ncbi:type III polyketide synthase [Alkalispirochaeta sphaeroplastigenens]|uniref:type III polyketide synthase n=1 Tax=Alkalispirochaeta sphaeroplastigenens TaxID=1187066 RepID=UPI000CDA360E|nr:type III polyketide synthase [Alkalispirochaeta sphaeroplastigenens]
MEEKTTRNRNDSSPAGPLSRQDPVWLQGIATVVPDTACSQEEAREFMRKVPHFTPKEQRFLDRLYQGTGIEERHSVIADFVRPREEFSFFSRDPSLLPEPSPADRNNLFITEARSLAIRAVSDLLQDLSWLDPSSITHLITVTCTGFSAPGFDYQVVQALNLSPTILRHNIAFMGCYAAFPALRLARTICQALPRARVLIVDVELCSLHVQFRPDPDRLVANAIFADGAAAALVSGDRRDDGSPRFRLDSFASRILPESAGAMSWSLGERAFDMTLSAYVPQLIREHLGELLEESLAEGGLSPGEISLWAIHPGGKAILGKVQEALGLDEQALEDSSRVLARYGNMSSATIFFVLRSMADRPCAGPVFAAAFGPGLTIETACLERVGS